MNLEEFCDKNPELDIRYNIKNPSRPYIFNSKMYDFLRHIFYYEFGDNGLDYLQYKKTIHDPIRNNDYYIDFAIEADDKKYAIILDENSYGTREGTNENVTQDERTNEIIRQGYKLFRYSCNHNYAYPLYFEKELRENLPIPSIRWINGQYQPDKSSQKGTMQESPLIREMKERKRKEKLANLKIILLTAFIIVAPILLLKYGGNIGLSIVRFLFWLVLSGIALWMLVSFLKLCYEALTKPSNPDDWPDPKGPHGF